MTTSTTTGLPRQKSARRTAPPNLSSVARRGEDAFVRAQRHSIQVRAVKLALPLAALALAALFVGYSWLKSPPTLDIEVDGSALQDGKLVMANPKLDGFGKNDLPYSMTAARAVQDLSDTNAIQLEDISARLPLSADNFATIGAKAGIYNNEKDTLEITTPLTVETDAGMSVTMQSAFIDIANGELKSNDPIDIRLDGSQIEANTFRVHDRGKVFIFEDGVRMRVDPSKLRAPDGQANEADGGN